MNWSAEVTRVVETFGLDLSGLTVLTELATGPFCTTPVISALGGSELVFAVGSDSRFGTFAEARDRVLSLAKPMGLSHKIVPLRRSQITDLEGVNIVTNLGHVRPIDGPVIATTAAPSCVALMWEPWEFRPEDLDLELCSDRGVVVIGTNESHELIAMEKYLGLLAARLLLERQVSIAFSQILVLGNQEFSEPICKVLNQLGAHATAHTPEGLPDTNSSITDLHAIVFADHSSECPADDALIELVEAAVVHGVEVINISGLTAEMPLSRLARANVHPRLADSRRYMAVTTGVLGVSPVIRLHAGGLRAAQEVCRALSTGASRKEAIERAVRSGFGQAFPDGIQK